MSKSHLPMRMPGTGTLKTLAVLAILLFIIAKNPQASAEFAQHTGHSLYVFATQLAAGGGHS